MTATDGNAHGKTLVAYLFLSGGKGRCRRAVSNVGDCRGDDGSDSGRGRPN